MEKVDVAVLGASGPVGKELTGILKTHPGVANTQTPSRDELPHFAGSEVVFSALPHGKSAPQVARLRKLGSTVVDLSDELRLPSLELYEKWHPGQRHGAPQLISNRIPYGLPEIYRERLEPGTKLVSMPGCYPTATKLALDPLAKRQLLDPRDVIIVNALSGYSGRGKDADNSDLINADGIGYNVMPYKTGRKHQHVGEMEHLLGDGAVLFAPNVLPIERGMLVQAAVRLAFGVGPAEIREAFEETYESEPFVAVSPVEGIPDIAETAHTDECHIGFVTVKQTVLIGSSIDNLRKGAASQAVQVFNIINGFPETTGLTPKAGYES